MVLDDLDDGAHQVDGLAQADRPGQLARGGAEDLGGDRAGWAGSPAPRDERRDAGLGDQPHPGAVVGGQRAVPLVVGLHLLHRGGAEVTGGAGDPSAGGGRRRVGRADGIRRVYLYAVHNPAAIDRAGQSVPNSIAASSSARSSSSPSAPGWRRSGRSRRSGSSPNRVPFSTSTGPWSSGWPA